MFNEILWYEVGIRCIKTYNIIGKGLENKFCKLVYLNWELMDHEMPVE